MNKTQGKKAAHKARMKRIEKKRFSKFIFPSSSEPLRSIRAMMG